MPAGGASQAQRALEAPAAALADDALARVETLFARYIGPMAKVLVKREAKGADSVEALCRALAGHIDKPADRLRFLADAGF
jgi:serine/threonine-protein kinase